MTVGYLFPSTILLRPWFIIDFINSTHLITLFTMLSVRKNNENMSATILNELSLVRNKQISTNMSGLNYVFNKKSNNILRYLIIYLALCKYSAVLCAKQYQHNSTLLNIQLVCLLQKDRILYSIL